MKQLIRSGLSRFFPTPRRFRRQVRSSYTILPVLALLTFYSIISNLVYASYKTAFVGGITLTALLTATWLHHIGRHKSARFVMITTLNVSVFLASYFLPQNSNMSLFLLSFVGLPFIVMSWRENKAIMAYFCALPIVLWIILMLTNYGGGAYFELPPETTEIFGYGHSIMIFAIVLMEFLYYDSITKSYSRALRRSLRSEARANASKTAFLRSMSHEMRTPLGAVLGAADLLRDHPKAGPEVRDLARIIATSGNDLLSLTEKSMAYAQIASGALAPNLEPTDPHPILTSIVERFRDKSDSKDIHVELSKTSDAKIQVDPSMLSEALVQIYDNALTYTPRGGSVTAMIMDASNDRVRLEICDTGPGIPDENHSDVFEPFERLGQTYGTQSGSGVGLTIARAYVKAMQGDIGLLQAPERGTHVWIELPATTH